MSQKTIQSTSFHKETVFPITSRAKLYALSIDRFKTSRLSLVSVLPQTRKTAVLCPLLLSVLTQGCEGYPSFEAISCRADELWGSLLRPQDQLWGERRVFGLSVSFIDPAYLPGNAALLGELVDLIRRILFFPLTDETGLLPEKAVEIAKKRQCDSIRSLISSPRRFASEHAEAFFFGDRPCGIPDYGSEEETNAVTPAELTAFWKDWRKTAFLSCFYVGASDPLAVAEVLKAAFGKTAVGKAEKAPPFLVSNAPVAAAEVRRMEEPFPIEQGHLIFGFQTGGKPSFGRRQAAMQLANELLGGAPTSLLFMNVREKLSLCYSVSSLYSPFRSALFIKCALDPDNRETAENEILHQVDRLKKGDFTDAELESARNSLLFAYRTISDDSDNMERAFLRRVLTPDGKTPEEMIVEIQSVTRREVLRAANLLSLETVYFLRGTQKEGQHEI
ncbi:MAG: insulinase family protein [Ruminococcaceae bacterium]|nr:insulinase family protein [Oscillospiraceae bacterium]